MKKTRLTKDKKKTPPKKIKAVIDPKAGYVPLKDLAAFVGADVRTLRRFITNPNTKFPHFCIGRRILVKKTDLEDWVSALARARSRPMEDDNSTNELLRSALAHQR